MKIIMYHYVRELNKNFPYAQFLDISCFKMQLDYLDQKYCLIKSEDELQFVLKNPDNKINQNKVLLTFDDALWCHYTYVFPELIKRNLWGIFFVPTACLNLDRVLPVHKLHLLFSKFESSTLTNAINKTKVSEFFDNSLKVQFSQNSYRTQSDSELKLNIKRCLNYYISEDNRREVLDILADFLNFSYYSTDVYINTQQLSEMHFSGMGIGAHTVNHPILSKLRYDEKRYEIGQSIEFIRKLVGVCKYFSYPHGRVGTYDEDDLNLVKEFDCLGFTVDDQEAQPLLKNKGFGENLKRLDCNQFPYGNINTICEKDIIN